MTNLEERQKTYSQLRERLLQNQLSNSENFDKAILSLSSAGLGISLTLVRYLVGVTSESNYIILKLSWFLFVSAIISTILSFVSSQKGIERQLYYAEKYYLDDDEDFFNKKNIYSIITNGLNGLSALFFIFAVVVTVIFASLNVENGGQSMPEKKNTNIGLAVNGAKIPTMQKSSLNPEKRGAPVPPMAPIQQPSGTGNANNNNSTLKK